MVQVNLLAVLLCGVTAMVIGALWYSPILFGNIWMKLSGISMKDLESMKKKDMAMSYILNFIAALFMAFVLANIAQYGGADTAFRGAMLGLWISLGFVATSSIGMVLWEGRSWKLWFLLNVYQMITLMAMGAIIAAWPATPPMGYPSIG